MKSTIMHIKNCLLLVFLIGYVGARAQVTEIDLSIPNDSTAFMGDVVRMPILLDTDVSTENILAYRLEISYSSYLSPGTITSDESITSSWGDPTVNIDETNRRIVVTGAGISAITEMGALFFIDFEVLNDINSNAAVSFYSSGNNYFNEGGYTLNFTNGYINIDLIPRLSMSFSNTAIIIGDSSRVNISGGTEPYLVQSSNESLAEVVSNNYLKGLAPGLVTATGLDDLGVTGETSNTLEIRGFGLTIKDDLSVDFEQEIQVPVIVSDLSTLDVLSGTFRMNFGNRLEFVNVVQAETLLEGISLETNATTPGQLVVSFASTASIPGADTLLYVTLKGIQAGNSSVSFDEMLFNEDVYGLSFNRNVMVNSAAELTVSRSGNDMIPGDTKQYTASGGVEPYTWSVNDESLATIDENGLLTAIRGGNITVFAEDNDGVMGEAAPIKIYDGDLTIAEHNAPVGYAYDLPIYITEMPEGREIYAFDFTINYNEDDLTFNSVTQSGSLSEGWSIVTNTNTAGQVRIVAASSTAITSAGELLYLNFDVSADLGIGSNTYLSFNGSSLFNEGTPELRQINGRIYGSLVPPNISPVDDITINEDELYTFTEADFGYSHPEGNAFYSVIIESINQAGHLQYNGSDVYAGLEIQVASFNLFTFIGAQNENGEDYASFEYRVSDGSTESNDIGTLTFDLSPVNDAPLFSISGDVHVEFNFVTEESVIVTPEEVPTDETSQTVSYTLSPESVDFANVSIDANTGEVTILATDGEYGTQEFTIVADDGQTENNTAEVSFTLTVDDTVPVIDNQTFSIDENSAIDTQIATIAASDEDGDILTYEITSGNESGTFSLDASTGVLSVFDNTALDFEVNLSFNLTVQVGDPNGNVDSGEIVVNVNNVNEAPEATDASFDVNENSGIETEVGVISASDPDGDELAYSITAGNDLGGFAIEGTTGLITVADETVLNFEVNTSFELTVQVADPGNLFVDITVTISLLDQNDIPVVADQEFSVDENSTSGTLVGAVAASDEDGDQLTFEISSGNDLGGFSLDFNTGDISVANAEVLDFETNPTFVLAVSVADGNGGQAGANITINLNDIDDGNNPPEIADQSFSINENSASGTLVGTVVASDTDGDPLTFQIMDGNSLGGFALHAVTGNLTVNDATVLDFETNPSFSLTVQVSDGKEGTDQATIAINLLDLDESENAIPVINNQSFAIDENSVSGTHVGTVVATDEDNDPLNFTIINGNGLGGFVINSVTGDITVNDATVLDFETNPNFSLTVQVSDGNGGNANGTISIDLNDLDESTNNVPEIADQVFDLDENTPSGNHVGTVVASDPDDDPLNFTIVNGNDLNGFTINNSTGDLVVNDATVIDFEFVHTFTLTVQVNDGNGGNANGTITININDLDESENTLPVVNDQTFSIAENSVNGTVVGTVIATDADGHALTYAIVNGNGLGGFAIGSASGEVTVANQGVLDFELRQQFLLTVQVSDGNGGNVNATITINLTDVDDTPNTDPVINNQSFSLDENSASGTFVGTVLASDADDDNLTFSITAGNELGGFSLDASTGDLTVDDASVIDFETNPDFSLNVQVDDGNGGQASATVTINLNDLDDQNSNPQISNQSFSLDENSPTGTLVGTIQASDPDEDNLSFTIVSGNNAGGFALNSGTGDLTVADESIMDFETTQSFSLRVEVRDGNGGSAQASITVNLNDLDDDPLSVKTQDIKFYPNPVSSTLQLQGLPDGNYSVQIVDLSGKVQMADELNTTESKLLDFRDLRSGIYMIVLTGESDKYQFRVVKE